MLEAFESALNNAKERGEVAQDFDTKPVAEYLLASAMGIQVFVRSRGSVSSASALGRIALDVVEAWQRDAAKQNKTPINYLRSRPASLTGKYLMWEMLKPRRP